MRDLKRSKYKKLQLLKLKLRVLMPDKMMSLFKPKRYKFYYGGRGGAKSVSVAKFLLNEGNKRKVRILCAREIQDSIKASVHSLLKDLIDELDYSDYVVNEKTIYNTRTKTEFIFVGLFGQDKKQSVKSYANIDYCWVEEAQAVSKGSLDVLIPSIRKPNSELIFTFNRLKVADPVWVLQKKIYPENKILQKINYYDNLYLPDVLFDEAMASKRRYETGQDDDYLHIWLGNEINLSDKTIIALRDVQDAIDRRLPLIGSKEYGVDLARYGKDRTVFVERIGLKVLRIEIHKKKGEPETIRLLKNFMDKDKSALCKIDGGYMPGVIDFMKEDGYNVHEINNGSKANNVDRYNNRISEMWFEFEKLINEIELPDLEELTHELTTREWVLDKHSRKIVESKDLYKARGNKSPDIADAVLLCFAKVKYIKNITEQLLTGEVINDEYQEYNLNNWTE